MPHRGDQKPRILHLVPADGIGGVEIAAKSMLGRDDLPCDFRLQFIEDTAPGRLTVASVLGMAIAHWRALWRAKAFDPDVVICSLWRSVPVALALRAIHRRAKLVYFIHNEVVGHPLDGAMSAIARRLADEVWGDSASALEARGVTQERSRVISFVTARTDLIDKPFMGARFVSWGRLNRVKGYDRAIRLVELLVKSGLDVRYDLYGPDDGERAALIALVDELGLRDHVSLPGPISKSDIPVLSRDYSFFLQPSRSEGMCMGVVEAMQQGLVPIVTPVGEMARYVTHGETGLIINPDSLAASSASIEAVIRYPAAWNRQSLAAMRFWYGAPLYADEIYRAAVELSKGASESV